MIWLALGIGLLVLLLGGMNWFTRANPKTLAWIVKYIGGGLLALAAVVMVLTGKIVLGGPLGLAALALFRGWIGQPRGRGGQGRAKSDSRMTTAEAHEILGLKPGAGPDEIKAAHRRLMTKIHPDHGGSDYLAMKINQAKDFLLKQ